MTEYARRALRDLKGTIRSALDAATDTQLIELLTAARAGRVPWGGAGTLGKVDDCGCLAQRLGAWKWWGHGREWLSEAYAYFVPLGCDDPDGRRQRILVAMCKAAIRRRTADFAIPAPAPVLAEV